MHAAPLGMGPFPYVATACCTMAMVQAS
jgi:hypothetical protein